MKSNPPIPSPFPDPPGQQFHSRSTWKTYVPMLLSAVLMSGFLMVAAYLSILLYVGLVFILLYIVVSIYGTYQVKSLGDKLGYVVRSRDDLPSIRRVIDLNMKFAFLGTVIVHPLILVSLIRGVFVILLLIAVSLLMLPFILQIEKKFKTMQVAHEDPAIAQEFRELIAEWKEPRFGLSKEG